MSLLRAAGVSDEDVVKAAGHASPQVTMSMYAHALAGSARRVADTVNRLVPIDPDDTSDEQALRSTLLALRVRRASVRGSMSDGGSQGWPGEDAERPVEGLSNLHGPPARKERLLAVLSPARDRHPALEQRRRDIAGDIVGVTAKTVGVAHPHALV